MAIKSILFDADGVVINSKTFSVIYSTQQNIPIEEMIPFFENELQQCIIGKADLKEVLKPWLPKWKWEKSVDEFLQFWFESENSVCVELINKIKEFRSKGIKCYLATNQEKYRTQYFNEVLGFRDLFDGVFSSGLVGHKKPSKEFYESILNELNISNPAEVLFFDDKKKHVEGAKLVGIDAHVYTDYESFERIIAQKVFSD